MGFMFVIYMFLSNNPSSGDINSSNLPCSFYMEIKIVGLHKKIWFDQVSLNLILLSKYI